MELFKDKTYDDLDEISQLVEPYVLPVNEDLAKLDDEVAISKNILMGMVNTHGSITKRKILKLYAADNNLDNLYSHVDNHFTFADEFFEFKIEPDTTFNPATNELIGEVKLVKKKVAYEDNDIEQMMLNHMNSRFRSFPRPRAMSVGRLNEVCDLFGAKEALKARGAKEKLRLLRDRYEYLLSDKTLNIRDYDLFTRFMRWNHLYIVDGNLPAMSNITKIKIMMRSELPIYSIKEEEV